MAGSHKEQDSPHTLLPSDPALRVKVIETLLVGKGLVDPAAIDTMIDAFRNKIGPQNGSRVIARAWIDPEYKAQLLSDASSAIADLGYSGLQGEHMIAVENTESVHNVVVCTLCSCYPWPVLGIPPVWYKSEAYRSRVVRDPRGVLAEFGLTIDPDTPIRVWDSTSEMRYLVIPRRPEGSDNLSEEVLASLVTRNSMIGTGLANAPEKKKDL